MIEVFRVAVHLGVVGNATEVLQLMLRHLTGIQGSQRQINANFARMALLAGSAMTAMAGVAVLRGLWDMAKAGKELNEELLKTRQLTNMTPVQMAQARTNDFRVAADTRVVAPSQVERYTRDLITQLGNRPDAQLALGEAIKAAYVVHNQTGENQEEVIKNLIKVADIRARIFSVGPDGKEYTDYKKLIPELQGAVNSLIISGGYMNSQKLLAMATTGGLPAKGMTPEAFYAGAMEMAISQGASRTGTSLTSLFSQLVGGTMTKRTAVNMTRAGLLEPGDWTSGKSGGVVVGPTGTRRFAGFEEDPIAWITGPGKAAIEKFATDQKISTVAAVFQIFGRQTTQRLVGEAIQSGPQFARAREFFRGVADLQVLFNRLQAESVNLGIVDVQTAWKGLMEALTDSPATVALLHTIADAIRGITAAVVAHPEAARYLVELTAAIAGLAVVGGGLLVLRIGLGALMGPLRALAAVTGLGAAAGGISAVAVALAAISRLAFPAWLLWSGVRPGSTQSPEADRAPYGGKSLSERFPGLVVPHSVPLGPVAPGTIVPPPPSPAAKPEVHSDAEQSRRFGAEVGAAVKLAMGNVAVYMDRTKVGQLVSDHQADQMNRPPTGGNTVDIRVSPHYAGTGGNWALA